MIKQFTLPLSNCYPEFEKAMFDWFEGNSDQFDTWLRNDYSVHVCGHPVIDYVEFSLKDGMCFIIVNNRVASGFWHCIPFKEVPCAGVQDLLNIIYKHTGHPEEYCK